MPVLCLSTPCAQMRSPGRRQRAGRAGPACSLLADAKDNSTSSRLPSEVGVRRMGAGEEAGGWAGFG